MVMVDVVAVAVSPCFWINLVIASDNLPNVAASTADVFGVETRVGRLTNGGKFGSSSRNDERTKRLENEAKIEAIYLVEPSLLQAFAWRSIAMCKFSSHSVVVRHSMEAFSTWSSSSSSWRWIREDPVDFRYFDHWVSIKFELDLIVSQAFVHSIAFDWRRTWSINVLLTMCVEHFHRSDRSPA